MTKIVNSLNKLLGPVQGNLKESTTKVLSSLTPDEERILRDKFGIGKVNLKTANQKKKVTSGVHVRLHTSKLWCRKKDIMNLFYNEGWCISRLAQRFKVSNSTITRIIHFNLI